MLRKIAVVATLLTLAFGLLLLLADDSRFSVDSSVLLTASPQQVWRQVRRVETWPAWWPGVEAAALVGPLAAGGEIRLRLKGRPETDPALLVEVTEAQELSWERDGVLGSRAGTRLLLVAETGGCRVRIENYVHGPQAVLARITGREAFLEYQRELLARLGAALVRPGEKD